MSEMEKAGRAVSLWAHLISSEEEMEGRWSGSMWLQSKEGSARSLRKSSIIRGVHVPSVLCHCLRAALGKHCLCSKQRLWFFSDCNIWSLWSILLILMDTKA